MNQLHNQYCLSYTCTTKQTDLSALCVRTNQVNNLNTCLKNLGCRHLLLIGRCLSVNAPALCILRCRLFIYRIAQKIKYSSKACIADWNADRCTCVNCIHATNHTISRVHRNAAHNIVTDLLGNLCNDAAALIFNLNGIKQFRKLSFLETNIQNRTHYLNYLANMSFTHIFTFHQLSEPATISVISCVIPA